MWKPISESLGGTAYFSSSFESGNSRKKAVLEATLIILIIQPIFTSEGKMVSGPRKFFLKFMMDQLKQIRGPDSPLITPPFPPYLMPATLFLLDFYSLNVLCGDSSCYLQLMVI